MPEVLDLLPQHLERVDHDVADAIDLLRGHALGAQIRIRIPGRRPQEIRDRIRDQPIDLLGHAAVAAAQASLQVHDRDPQLGADHGTGGGRVDVAHHHDGVRAGALADDLVGHHRAPGLLGMRAAADFEVVRRFGQAQVPEEGVRHVRVVVLPGVHDGGLAPAFAGEGVVEGGHLHEIGAGRGDQVDGLRIHGVSGLWAAG